jgi:hydroxyacyl-ACP dehydratase HTD2-like protein with hotdog domain
LTASFSAIDILSSLFSFFPLPYTQSQHIVAIQPVAMAFITRRLFTSSARALNASSAEAIAASFLKSHENNTVTRSQLLDANQATLTYATLDKTPPSNLNGTPLPLGYHLTYFTPTLLTSELGHDGTDGSYNPEAPFTRRMWAGGEMVFEKGNPLRVGEEVTEETKVRSAKGTKTAKGDEMVVVGVEKRFSNDRGLALVDKRFVPYCSCAWDAGSMLT